MGETTSRRAEHHAGTVADFANGVRRFLVVDGTEVGVIEHDGELHAFANVCPHQGGPVCEGLIVGKVEEVLDEQRRLLASRFSTDRIHLVCPWHGMEFDLRTGRCAPDPRRRLRRYDVVRRGDDVYVLA